MSMNSNLFFTRSVGSSGSYLESVIQALESRNSHVRDSVLDRIHEFIILCQGIYHLFPKIYFDPRLICKFLISWFSENGEEILMKIFELGVSSNIQVLPALRKSLSLLRNYSCTS